MDPNLNIMEETEEEAKQKYLEARQKSIIALDILHALDKKNLTDEQWQEVHRKYDRIYDHMVNSGFNMREVKEREAKRRKLN